MKAARTRSLVGAFTILTLVCGCASHRPVKCDDKLEPINQPAPKVLPATDGAPRKPEVLR